MKRKELKKIVLLLTVAAVIGGVPTYSNASTTDKNTSICNTSESTNENGYTMKKYEGIDQKQWIESNKVLRLNPMYIKNGVNISNISTYNLDTKEEKKYENVKLASLHGVSPNGRYVLFVEPRDIAEVESEEWRKSIESGEFYYAKQDILDLQTGKIITEFDKTPHNYQSQYKWINDDYIFANHYSSWKIMNKNGEVIKEGKFDYKGYSSEWAKLVDVSELKVEDNKVSGRFYYTKDFMGDDRNLGEEIFSMDVNSQEENSIKKCCHTLDVFKESNTIVADFFNNNGPAVGGYFINRTFGFNVLDRSGNLIRSYELPFGKNYDKLSLSTDGERCAFLEFDDYMNPNRDPKNSVLKVLNIKTGEVKEIKKALEVMDLTWSKDGKTLMFSSYGKGNCKDTYTVTFNN